MDKPFVHPIDKASYNKPETNRPLTGTHTAAPGKSLSAGDIGQLNSRVVPPYSHQNLGPVRPPVQSPSGQPMVQQPAQEPLNAPKANIGPAEQPKDGALHNQRPAILGDAAKKAQEKSRVQPVMKPTGPTPQAGSAPTHQKTVASGDNKGEGVVQKAPAGEPSTKVVQPSK